MNGGFSRDRLVFLVEVVEQECALLASTNARLFASPFTAERAQALRAEPEASERVDAFVARFARLQDTLGDKLLPEVLRQLAEPVGPAIDNLDRAEKLGLLASADEWLIARKLRNRMVHEYVRDAQELAQALNEGHVLVNLLIATANRLRAECERRGWLGPLSSPVISP